MLIAIITSLTGFVLCSVLAATMFMFWKSYHIWKKSSTNFSGSLATNLHEICKTKTYTNFFNSPHSCSKPCYQGKNIQK